MILGLFLSAVLLGLTSASSELYGKYLTGFTFASFDKMGKQMCVRECQSYPGRCKSVNYNRVHLSCDLNTDSATDKPEAILDREGSTHITISILANNSVCGDLQCSTQEKCVVKKSRPSCVFIGCDLPRIKNAEDNGGILMYRKTLQCKTGYRALASLMCSERGLDKNATEFRCYKEVDQWILIYRGQSGGTDSDYLSFISNGTSDETNKNVNDEYCTSITKSPLCTTNYRTSLIDRWQSLGISQDFHSNKRDGCFYSKQAKYKLPYTKTEPRWWIWCLMVRVPTKRAGSLPVKSCPVPGPMSSPIKRTGTSTLKDMSHLDNGEIFKYGKVTEVVRMTYFGCHHHMLNQGRLAPRNKQAQSSIYIVPIQPIVTLNKNMKLLTS